MQGPLTGLACHAPGPRASPSLACFVVITPGHALCARPRTPWREPLRMVARFPSCWGFLDGFPIGAFRISRHKSTNQRVLTLLHPASNRPIHPPACWSAHFLDPLGGSRVTHLGDPCGGLRGRVNRALGSSEHSERGWRVPLVPPWTCLSHVGNLGVPHASWFCLRSLEDVCGPCEQGMTCEFVRPRKLYWCTGRDVDLSMIRLRSSQCSVSTLSGGDPPLQVIEPPSRLEEQRLSSECFTPSGTWPIPGTCYSHYHGLCVRYARALFDGSGRSETDRASLPQRCTIFISH